MKPDNVKNLNLTGAKNEAARRRYIAVSALLIARASRGCTHQAGILDYAKKPLTLAPRVSDDPAHLARIRQMVKGG